MKHPIPDVPLGYTRTNIGVIPKDWSCFPIKAIASSERNAIVGGPFGSDLVSKDYVEHGVPVIRGINMNSRLIKGPFVFVTNAKAKSLAANLARPGDLVFTQRGTLGQVSLVPEQPYNCYLVSQSQMKVTLNRNIVDPAFLLQVFSAPVHQKLIRDLTIQTGVPHINLGILRTIPVQVPSVGEQRLIADALSDVDRLLTALEALIAKKRAIQNAAMQQLLTGNTRLPGFQARWEMTKMGQLGSIYGGLAGKNKEDFGVGSGRYITFLNILENVTINPEQCERVHISPAESQNRVLKGDLLFNATSETAEDLGMASVLNEAIDNLYLNSFCFGFRSRAQSRYNPLFLTYLFRGAPGRRILYALAQGATRYNLSKRQFLALELPIPEPREQLAIATALSDMDAEIAALEARRDKTRMIKQGMMQQLLTGRIRLVKPEAAEVIA